MAVKKAPSATTLEIQPLKQGRMTLRMMGTTPLYFNSMSSKAMRDLLVGGVRKPQRRKRKSSTILSKSSARACIKSHSAKHCFAFPHLASRAQWQLRHLRLTGLPKQAYSV